MLRSETVTYGDQVIQYHIYGYGKKVMLGFHGFGQEGTNLGPIGHSISDNYTLYSFDLFYHGKSYWKEGENSITKDFWKEFLEKFLEKHKIDTFSVCGFSMGARFAMATVEAFADRINTVLLLAPDGINISIWYRLATFPGAFRSYFRSMITKPQRFFRLLDITRKLGLINKSLSKFASTQMSTVKKRRQVYYSWLVFRDLSFNIKAMAKLINHYDIKVHIFLGNNDSLITLKGINRLLKHLNRYQLHHIKSSHHKLIENTAGDIERLITNCVD